MKDNLDAAEAMELLSAAQKTAALDGLDEFGTSVVLLDAAYDDVVARSFVPAKDGKPRSEEDYDRAGRLALARLALPGEADDYRRRPALDDAIWEKMKILGQPGFSQVFPALSTLQLEVVRADYTVIRWWSQAMHRMAVELEKVDSFLKENPHADLEGQEFNPFRQRLRKALESVARHVKAQFGDPWGVVAMDMASNHKADARFRLICPLVSLNVSREEAPRSGARSLAGGSALRAYPGYIPCTALRCPSPKQKSSESPSWRLHELAPRNSGLVSPVRAMRAPLSTRPTRGRHIPAIRHLYR